MKHKIEAIDYLRGVAILSIVFIHIILPTMNSPQSIYSSKPLLFSIREILNFSIVAIIMCSGFSLYLSAKNLKYRFQDILLFYKKRLKRLILPWWTFCIISFISYYLAENLLNIHLEKISLTYIISSFLLIGGLPLRWLILLLVMLSLLFPLFKYFFEKNSRIFVSALLLSYLFFIIISISNPYNVYQTQNNDISFISKVSFNLSFILGWSLVYLLGFFLEELYNKHKLMKKELKVTFNFIFLSIIIYIVYSVIGLNTALYANKYPPSPYYLSYGIAVTFVLLNLFFAYKHFIHTHLKKILSFFSSNSYWLFLWSAGVLLPVQYLFSFLSFLNVYLRLVLEFVISIILITLLVLLQKKLIKIEMHLEKHHF